MLINKKMNKEIKKSNLKEEKKNKLIFKRINLKKTLKIVMHSRKLKYKHYQIEKNFLILITYSERHLYVEQNRSC